MANSQDNYENNEADFDLTSLLNKIDDNDPVYEDVNAINDLLKGLNEVNNEEEKKSPKDVGDVFSDTLDAISHLKEEDNIKKDKELADDNIKKDKKKNNLKRLFEKRLNKDKTKKEKPKKVKEVKTKKVKEVKPKKVKEVKPKKVKEVKPKKVKVEKAKKEKKPVIYLIDELEDNESSINLFSSMVIFVILTLLISLVFIGTNLYNYTKSIKRATDYFDVKAYNEAFTEIYGVNVKDEDIEIYDKIITVMYVNKQLNSYNNFYGMKMYYESLDALFNGLSRYEKYIELARLLGIESDLDYVREQILAELNGVFNVSEKEAIKIIKTNDISKYKMKLNNIIAKNTTLGDNK